MFNIGSNFIGVGGGIKATSTAVGKAGKVADAVGDIANSARNIAEEAAKMAKNVGLNDMLYGASDGGNLRKLLNEIVAAKGESGNSIKILTDFDVPDGQSVRTFSTGTIDEVIAAGNKIHFDLSALHDVQGVLNNTGTFANTVTGTELRYIMENWSKFNENVIFYVHGNVVKAPWLP
jgi:hypothetical protein